MALCHERLTVNLEVRDNRGIIACLAAARGQTVHAAQLFGAVEAWLESSHTQLLMVDRDQSDRNLAALRAQLDQAMFNAAWNEGRAMPMKQAIAYALQG